MSRNDVPPEARKPSTGLRTAVGVLALLVLLYSVLIATRPLLGVAVVVWLVGLYLVWKFFLLASRFVRAVERIADAMERTDADATEYATDETAGGSSRSDSGAK